jgi:hypothetical protein
MSNVRARHMPFTDEIAWRLAMVPVLIVLCLLLKVYLPLEVCGARARTRVGAQALHTSTFYVTHSFAYRFAYMIPVFAYLRTRVYVAWLLAECCCILATIGAYQSSGFLSESGCRMEFLQ